MNLNIHFISFDLTWVDAISQLFSDISGVTATHGNIKSLPRENTVFVSPANSLGYMDGGIDYVLSREMFPGLQTIVQDSIATYGLVNGFGRHYLPVGSALYLQIHPTTHLIVAPTMFQPRDVPSSANYNHTLKGCGYLGLRRHCLLFQFSTSHWDVLIIGNRRSVAHKMHTGRCWLHWLYLINNVICATTH
jgi:hypothetical protein